jgi:hypothetical protein
MRQLREDIVDHFHAGWRDRYPAHKITGALVDTLKRQSRHVVAVQPARQHAFNPRLLDCNDSLARSKKSFDVCAGSRRTGIEGDAGTVPRDQVVAQTISINGPHDRVTVV